MRSPDPDSHLSYVIAKVSHQLGVTIDRTLSEQGITLTQFSALAHIARSPGLSSAQLARALLTTPQATTTLVRRLIDAGFVQRTSVGPGLAAAIRLTPRGHRRLAAAEDAATRAENEALSSLHERERPRLAELLIRLSAALEEQQTLRGTPER